MKKRRLLIVFIFGFFSLCFADENITITTYYPSPYGSYNQLYVADKLGIGTTAPGARFMIEADGSAASPGSYPTQSLGYILSWAGDGPTTDTAIPLFSIAAGRINTTDSYAANARLFSVSADNGVQFIIRGTGYVGIGTTAPTRKLNVSGTGSGYTAISLTDTTQGVDLKNFVIDNRSQILGFGTDNDTGSNFNYLMAITRAGNVGIGTTNPGQKLEVNGYISSNNPASGGWGGVYATGDTGSLAMFGSGGGSDNYIESSNRAWNTSRDLHITGYSAAQGNNLYVNFANSSFNGNVKMGYEQITGADSVTCNNCWQYVTATCPSGKYVIGGGCGSSAGGAVIYSKPGDNSSWSCYVTIGSTYGHANAYAICANIR